MAGWDSSGRIKSVGGQLVYRLNLLDNSSASKPLSEVTWQVANALETSLEQKFKVQILIEQGQPLVVGFCQ